MLVAPVAHEVANALVHGDAGRGHQAGHGRNDAVIPRRHHARARAQNGNQLEHVVVVGGENRNARQKFSHGSASMSVETFHGNKDRENAMTFAESSGRFAKSRNVMSVSLI